MALGETLLEKRKQLNLTQIEAAEKLFVSRQTIANWERGKTLPDIESLISLAEFYQLSLDEIFLKGSDVVEDIKSREKVFQEYRWFGIPIGILILIIFLVCRSIVKQDISNILLLTGLLVLLICQIFFLEFQLRKVQRITSSLLTRKKFLAWLILFIMGGLAGFLLGCFYIFSE